MKLSMVAAEWVVAKKGETKWENTRGGKVTTKEKELKELILHQNRRREKKNRGKKLMPVCKCKVEQEVTNMEREREGEEEKVLCKWKDGRRRRKVRKNATLTDEI